MKHREAAAPALRIALTYALVGAVWILGSDWLLAQLVREGELRQQIGALKGWAFVGLTAALLYGLLRRRLAAPAPSAGPALPGWLRWAALLAAAALVALAARFAQLRGERFDQQLAQQLEHTAELRAHQVGQWLLLRREHALAAAAAAALAWEAQGDAQAALSAARAALPATAASGALALLHADGSVMADEGNLGTAEISAALRQTLARALAGRRVLDTGLYSVDPTRRQAWLDVVAPLPEAGPARRVLLLRADATESLLPSSREAAGAPEGAATLLVQRRGDMLVGAFGARPLPLSTPDLLAARAVRGEVPMGRTASGTDFRGVPVWGAVRPVADTAWFVVAKVDSAAVAAARRADAGWVAASALLALFLVGGGLVLVRARRNAAASQALRDQQEERLRSLMLMQALADGSSDAIFAKDTEGRYLLCNREAARLIGQPVERVLGADDRLLFPPQEAAAIMANDAAVLELGSPRTYEEKLTTPDGTRLFLATKGPLRDVHGQVLGMFGISRDVTGLFRANEELEQHRHRLQELVDERTAQLRQLNESLAQGERFMRTLADNMPGMLSYWDADLRCRFANRAYCDWFGRSAAGMEGIALHELLPPDRLQANQAAIERVLRGERVHMPPQALFDPAGREVHVLCDFIPDIEQGRVRGCLVLVSDISEVRQAELRLQAANEALAQARDHAEAASRAKSAFLANMSHEIRTPLNAVLGLNHLLRRDVHEPLQAERLAKVGDAAAHLLQVIDDVLDLSKIEAGRVVVEATDFSLRALLERARALVGERAAAKGLVLTLDAGEVPDALVGDPTRLLQVLLNLLGNAVKFTEKGHIGVTVQAAPPAEDGSLMLHVTVSDTGIGIPRDRQQELFSAFNQVDVSTTRRYGGTGLGLAITLRLARLMGGDAGLDSEPGVGSRFWFTARVRVGLPAAAGGPTGAGSGRPPPPPDVEQALRRRAAGARILLAEDNLINQDVACALLRAVDLQVEVVDDGLAAVQAALRGGHELLLMDMQMPGLDGLEATRRIRAAGLTLPIVAMTANAFGEDRAACLAAGMDEHVAKPVDPNTLYAVLLRWLPPRGAAPPGGPPAAAPALPAIDGLEVPQALRALAPAAYRQLLRKFVELYRGGLPGLEAALADGRAADAALEAHALRGAAGAIGALRLPPLAHTLEAMARDGRPAAELQAPARALVQELAALVAALLAALD